MNDTQPCTPVHFEWLEALALWRELRCTGIITGQDVGASEPLGNSNTWPAALPCVVIACLQWPDKTPAMNARRAAFIEICKAMPAASVEWKAPPMYAVGAGSQWVHRTRPPAQREQETAWIDAITATQAGQILTGMGAVPDRILMAWITHKSAPVPELAPAQQPAPAAPPEAVLMPPQAMPAAVVESVPNLAHCLPTAQVATVFDALPFSAERWRKNLSGNRWTWAAKRSAGEQGGAPAMWCPLTLAQLVHAREKDPKKKAAILRKLDSLFNRNELLAPHRAAWGEYFELMRND